MTDVLLNKVQINFDTQNLWLLNFALALVMFGIALEISFNDFRRLILDPKPIIIGVVSQFILLPAITVLLVSFLKPSPGIAMGMFMVAACPGGNVSNFMTHMAKGNTALSISLTAIATLMAIVMTPLNLQFWGSLYEPTAILLKKIEISPFEMVKLVALLLGIPLFLGITVNYRIPKFALKMARILKITSLLFFITLMFLALNDNKDIFIDYIMYVFWIVLVHNILALLTGFSFAKIMGLSMKDVRSVTIETGIQNAGLGLLLIFTFFDGLGGMALLAAFWGIWHLVSGLILATFWGYRPIKQKELL